MSIKLRSLALVLLTLMFVSLGPSPTTQAHSASTHTPVILIPGIGGSTLSNHGDPIWVDLGKLVGSQLPGLNLFMMNWLRPLRLGVDGSTPWSNTYKIEVGDILRQPIVDGYSGMVRALTDQGYTEGKNLRLMPYDWRKDPALATEQLGRLVDLTLRETGAKQVILIGNTHRLSCAQVWLGHGHAHPDCQLVPIRSLRGAATGAELPVALAAHNRAIALHASKSQERRLDGKNYGVDQFIIAGTGRATLGAIVERMDWLGVAHKTERMIDGDEVDPLLSADLGHSKDPERAAAQIGSIAGVAYVNQSHTLLAQSSAVQRQVVDWLKEIKAID